MLISAALLATGAPVGLAQTAPTDTTASGTSGAAGAQTGAQQSVTCATPRLKGLPKKPQPPNSNVHFKLTGMTPGAGYVIRLGDFEVAGGNAAGSTVKRSFTLFNLGGASRKVPVSAIVDLGTCENAPWKLVKRISYKAPAVPAPPKPATPAKPAAPVAPANPPAPAAASPKPVKPKPVPKQLKPKAKPLASPTSRIPQFGLPVKQRAWLPATDSGSRVETIVPEAKLSRLERKADKANSTNALVGLGIIFVLLGVSTIGGLMVFARKDDIQFEAALSEQLKHLEEGDPGLPSATEEPSTAPLSPAEQAPFAAGAAAAAAEGAANGEAPVEPDLARILNQPGFEAELRGIVAEARSEAERQGVAIDPDMVVQALYEELNGSANLSEPAREQLRSKVEQIIAEPPAAASQPVSAGSAS